MSATRCQLISTSHPGRLFERTDLGKSISLTVIADSPIDYSCSRRHENELAPGLHERDAGLKHQQMASDLRAVSA